MVHFFILHKDVIVLTIPNGTRNFSDNVLLSYVHYLISDLYDILIVGKVGRLPAGSRISYHLVPL